MFGLRSSRSRSNRSGRNSWMCPFITDEEKEIAQGAGDYARPIPADWMRRQAELVHERAKQADIIITTALIRGSKAPLLISERPSRP